jgi:hypothetical protein
LADEISALATKAIHESAELLGVDPFRLARFLGNGAIADLIESSMGGPAGDKMEKLAKELQSFLEHERDRIRESLGAPRPTAEL